MPQKETPLHDPRSIGSTWTPPARSSERLLAEALVEAQQRVQGDGAPGQILHLPLPVIRLERQTKMWVPSKNETHRTTTTTTNAQTHEAHSDHSVQNDRRCVPTYENAGFGQVQMAMKLHRLSLTSRTRQTWTPCIASFALKAQANFSALQASSGLILPLSTSPHLEESPFRSRPKKGKLGSFPLAEAPLGENATVVMNMTPSTFRGISLRET